MVKLKYRGPDTGQPAAFVTCKPMKSLRQQPVTIREGKWRKVSDSGRNLGQMAVNRRNRRSRLSRAGLGYLRGGDLIEVIGCTLGVSGCRKDGTVVSFENLQPRRDIGGVFFPRLLM